jgi:hypothetical protein
MSASNSTFRMLYHWVRAVCSLQDRLMARVSISKKPWAWRRPSKASSAVARGAYSAQTENTANPNGIQRRTSPGAMAPPACAIEFSGGAFSIPAGPAHEAPPKRARRRASDEGPAWSSSERSYTFGRGGKTIGFFDELGRRRAGPPAARRARTAGRPPPAKAERRPRKGALVVPAGAGGLRGRRFPRALSHRFRGRPFLACPLLRG